MVNSDFVRPMSLLSCRIFLAASVSSIFLNLYLQPFNTKKETQLTIKQGYNNLFLFHVYTWLCHDWSKHLKANSPVLLRKIEYKSSIGNIKHGQTIIENRKMIIHILWRRKGKWAYSIGSWTSAIPVVHWVELSSEFRLFTCQERIPKRKLT